jgi:hypothetical protein
VRAAELKKVEDSLAKRVKEDMIRKKQEETEKQRRIEAEWRTKKAIETDLSR